MCNWTPEVRDILKILWKRGAISPFPQYFLHVIRFSCLGSDQGPVVQSVVSLTSLLRVISLTVLADSIYNILIFFAEKI